MNTPVDVQQSLDQCMLDIKGASELMAHDMYDAAMKLGAAGMMLASASNTVYKRAVQPSSGRPRPDIGEDPRAEGS